MSERKIAYYVKIKRQWISLQTKGNDIGVTAISVSVVKLQRSRGKEYMNKISTKDKSILVSLKES